MIDMDEPCETALRDLAPSTPLPRYVPKIISASIAASSGDDESDDGDDESQETYHSNVKQANEITLKQIESATPVVRPRKRHQHHQEDPQQPQKQQLQQLQQPHQQQCHPKTNPDEIECGEGECLLGGQRQQAAQLQQQQQQQEKKAAKMIGNQNEQQHLLLQQTPRAVDYFLASKKRRMPAVSAVAASNSHDNVSGDHEADGDNDGAVQRRQQLQRYKMTQHSNTGSQTNSQLDVQKMSAADMPQQQQATSPPPPLPPHSHPQQNLQPHPSTQLQPEPLPQSPSQPPSHSNPQPPSTPAVTLTPPFFPPPHPQPLQQQQLPQSNNDNKPNEPRSTIVPMPTPAHATNKTTDESKSSSAAATTSGAGGGDGDGPGATNHPTNHPTNYANSHHGHHEYKGPKMWHMVVRIWPIISQPLALCAIFAGLWIILYCVLPKYAEPSSVFMRMVFLFVGAQIVGVIVTFAHCPDMLGMLFFGVLYTNVGLADFRGYQPLEAFLREIALINIMLLAGLGLDGRAFKKLWFMILRLTLIPAAAEVLIITVLAKFLLGMPWLWGILLGLVITAVSPNVVVTVMLKLKEERLGLNSGIHTLIYAMTSCNDVVAIFMFGVFLNGIFLTNKSLAQQILEGPIGIGIGIVFGYTYGLMLTFLPAVKTVYQNGLRFVLTMLGGTIAVMGSKAIGYPSAGALGCMTIAFFAGLGWKKQHKRLSQTERDQLDEHASVPKRLDLLWKFLKPISFALIGKEINFSVLDVKVVGYGVVLVLLGSLLRLAFAYLSTYGGNLSRKERAYITISGIPKATVQAALGPLALDLARSLNASDEKLALANKVLVLSVLAIILTAPLGAVLMLRLAPRWLERNSGPTDENGYPDDDSTSSSGSGTDLDNSKGDQYHSHRRHTPKYTVEPIDWVREEYGTGHFVGVIDSGTVHKKPIQHLAY